MNNHSHYLGDHTALTRTAFGKLIYVDTRDIHLTPHLLTRGIWEPNTTELFLDRIRRVQKDGERPLVLDVGANIGWFTLLAFMCGDVDVLAVEPNPHHRSLLYRTLCVNGYPPDCIRGYAVTSPERASVGNASLLRFNWDPQEGGGAAIATGGPGEDGERFEARGATLDALVGHDLLTTRPMVIKVDVEGHEPHVLAGATQLLQRATPPVLFLEHNLHHQDMAAEMYENLLVLGYQLRHIQASGHPSPPLTLPAVLALPTAEMLLCEVP